MPSSTHTPFLRITYFLTALVLGFVAVMQVRMSTEGDKDWLLLLARKMMQGQILYKDVLEINPPLIFWLYQIPVYISNLLGLQDAKVLSLLTLALTAISLVLSATLLKKTPTLFPSTISYHLTVILIAFILIFWPNSIYFGDREHLFFTLVLPFIIRFMPTVSTQSLSLRLRLAIAFMAAIGFCIKPYCLVFFITIQIINLAYTNNWRTLFVVENWIVGGAWALYILLIYTLTPEYFSFAIPMAISAYGAYKNEINVVVFFYCSAFLSFIFTFSGMKWRIQTPYRKAIYFLFGLMLAAVWYVSLNNGWIYTFYPLNSLLMLGLGLVWLEYEWISKNNSDNEKLIWDMKVARFFCAVVLTFNIAGTLIPYGMMFFTTQPKTYRDALQEDLSLVLKKNNVSSFGQLFSKYSWSKLALATNTHFEGRFRYAWPLPHYLKGDDAFKARNAWWIPTYLRQSMAEDLSNHKPDMVFVDTSPDYSGIGAPFDVIQYLSQDAQFAAAWGHYAFFQRINHCGKIDIYSKKEVHHECQYDVFKRRN